MPTCCEKSQISKHFTRTLWAELANSIKTRRIYSTDSTAVGSSCFVSEAFHSRSVLCGWQYLQKSKRAHFVFVRIRVEVCFNFAVSEFAFAMSEFAFAVSDLLSPWVIYFHREWFAFAVSDLLSPWANLLSPWVICFRCEWFAFAVSELIAFARSDLLSP